MRRLALLCCCLLATLGTPGPAAAQDNRLYAELLAAHVHDGLVDYSGLKAEEPKLDRYLDHLASLDADALPRDAAFAYYVNLYNAWTLKLILQQYPGIQSIKDIGSLWRTPWQRPLVQLRTGVVSLDHIEHEILRPRFKDPRLHFAVNCASMGCPRLHDQPFEAATLHATLDRLTRANLNDPAFNRLEGNTLHLIRVFDWFKEDWGDDADILTFVRHHAAPPLAQALDAAGDRLRIRFSEWDWGLNQVARVSTGGKLP